MHLIIMGTDLQGKVFFKSAVDKITISRLCSRKQKKIMLLQDELFLHNE